MNRVSFPLWDNEDDKCVNEINRVTNQMKSVGRKLKRNDIAPDEFEVFFDNVCQTLLFWTGRTYIGCKKSKICQNAFQSFFETLYIFIMICRELKSSSFREFAESVLYRGTLYRYLGHGLVNACINEKVKPQYNNTYVSWSKNPKNHYVESKLYGTMTIVICEVNEPYYGIDLNAFGVVRGEEAEVVFPTIKELITEVKYIER